jgi:hypothetical protein
MHDRRIGRKETTKLFWINSIPRSLQKNESLHSLHRVLQQVAAVPRFVSVTQVVMIKSQNPKSQTHASASDALNLAWSAVNSQGRIAFSSLQVQPGTTLA